MEKHLHYLGLVCVFVGIATLLFASTSPPLRFALLALVGLLCLAGGASAFFGRRARVQRVVVQPLASTSPPPSDADVTVFIERQLHEIRSFSARLTPVQRERLKAHVEFYSDEIKER